MIKLAATKAGLQDSLTLYILKYIERERVNLVFFSYSNISPFPFLCFAFYFNLFVLGIMVAMRLKEWVVSMHGIRRYIDKVIL